MLRCAILLMKLFKVSLQWELSSLIIPQRGIFLQYFSHASLHPQCSFLALHTYTRVETLRANIRKLNYLLILWRDVFATIYPENKFTMKANLSLNPSKRCFCYEHGNYRMADMTLGACVETRRGWYERPLNAGRKEKECFQTDKRDDFKVVPNSGDSRDGCAQTQSEGCPVDTMGPRVSLKWRVARQSISRHSFAILVGFPCADIT